MKLVIHCGVHKTATTSFQKLCAANRSLLRRLGVHYPMYGTHSQHSFVLWEAQQSGLDSLGIYLAKSCAQAKSDCHTVLMSGEDFENCIIDVALASEIEALAHQSGFDTVVWVVVTRPIVDAVSSIYSEMSKHGVVLNLDIVQIAAKERGCLYVSSASYNYIFVLDFARFRERFRRHVSGQVVEYELDCFIVDHPGMILLQQLLPEDAFIRFRQLAQISQRRQNMRLTDAQVETNYAAAALSLREIGRKRIARLLLAPFTQLRLRKARITKNSGAKSR